MLHGKSQSPTFISCVFGFHYIQTNFSYPNQIKWEIKVESKRFKFIFKSKLNVDSHVMMLYVEIGELKLLIHLANGHFI